jgi:hypothetical protein
MEFIHTQQLAVSKFTVNSKASPAWRSGEPFTAVSKPDLKIFEEGTPPLQGKDMAVRGW